MRSLTLLLVGLLVGHAVHAIPAALPGDRPAAVPAALAVPASIPGWPGAALAGPAAALPAGLDPERDDVERWGVKSLPMLRISLMGLGPEPPTGPHWVAFGAGTEGGAQLRVWARTGPAPQTFAITAPSLLGVAPEVLLDAHGSPGRAPLAWTARESEAPIPRPVPEPRSAVLVALGLAWLRRRRAVR